MTYPIVIGAHDKASADIKEPDVANAMRRILRPGDTFVDVGANVGMMSELGANLVGTKGHVLAIEPGDNCLPDLYKLAERHPNIKVIPEILWSHVKEVRFHICADGSGGNALWPPQEHPDNVKSRAEPKSYLIKTIALKDIYYYQYNLVDWKLIKIDAEGAEQRILEGGACLLEDKKVPYIIAELHQYGLSRLGCNQQSLLGMMDNYGYYAFLLQRNLEPVPIPFGSIVASEHVVNLLFSTDPKGLP